MRLPEGTFIPKPQGVSDSRVGLSAGSTVSICGCTVYRISVEPKHKTTLLLDAAVWRRFQEEVQRHEGGRAASGEVERLLRGADPRVFMDALAKVFPRPEGGWPSLRDVERGRPKIRAEVATLIREGRDEREDGVLGLKRDRETVRGRGRH